MSIDLDAWEKESRKGLNELSMLHDKDRPDSALTVEKLDKRILALIERVRDLDQKFMIEAKRGVILESALREIVGLGGEDGHEMRDIARVALKESEG